MAHSSSCLVYQCYQAGVVKPPDELRRLGRWSRKARFCETHGEYQTMKDEATDWRLRSQDTWASLRDDIGGGLFGLVVFLLFVMFIGWLAAKMLGG